MNSPDNCPRCGYPNDHDEAGDLFARSPAEWSDDELRVALVQLATRITELKATINGLTEIAAQLAAERDQRALVYAQAEEAMAEAAGVRVVGGGRLLQPPGLRRAQRRRDGRDPRVE